MNQCHNCGQDLPNTDATTCARCGTALEPKSDKSSRIIDDDDLDFVVTEAAATEPEFVGGNKKFEADDSDELNLESTHEATLSSSSSEVTSDPSPTNDSDGDQDRTIGQSSPILPEPQEIDRSAPVEASDDYTTDNSPELQANSTGSVRRLSEDDVKKIEQDLYGSDEFISDHDKSNLLNKISALPKQSSPKPDNSSAPDHERHRSTDPNDKAMAPPKMAGMSRGVAFFYKNYLHVPAIHEFHDGDELFFGEREYLIRPKKFNTRLFIGVATLLFVAFLFFIGSLFINNVSPGMGHVVGVVYNLNGTTNINGASVRFPNLNLTVESDAQGFFRSGTLPSGPHQVEYILNGKVAMTDYVTVYEERVSTINLFPRQPTPKKSVSSKRPRPQKLAQATEQPSLKETTTPLKQSSKPKAQEKSTRQKSSSSRSARIKLNADVDGARFSLDGKVLGAGNLIYSRLSPGKHSYSVSLDGYYEQTGNVRLVSGKTLTLEVSLVPMEIVEKEVTLDYEDFYYSGVTALNEGFFDRAIDDLNEAIDLEPSYTDAYLARGKVFLKIKRKQEAHDNFLRAAEILVFKKSYNHAITAYNSALAANRKSVPALIGRGQTYLAQGQEIAAVADFQTAKKYDKRNFAAYYGIGEARFQQGNYKKSIDAFKKARSLNSNHPLVHQYLMLGYLARNDFKNVRKSFKKFKKSASEEEYNGFLADKKSAAVMQIVENK